MELWIDPEKEKLSLATLPVNQAKYQFIDGVLCRIEISTTGEDRDELIESAYSHKYGTPTMDGDNCVWVSGGTKVQVLKGTGIVWIYDEQQIAEFSRRWSEGRSKKRAAAAKDL